MPTYQEYQQQIAELKNLATAARDQEVAHAKAKIFNIMEEFGITFKELKASPAKSAKPRQTAPIKYRNNETGKTWSGRGRTPRWLEGKQKDTFLVN